MNLQPLKEIIWKAVPEILELKFGCELKYPGYERATLCGQQINFWKVYCKRKNEVCFNTVTPGQLQFSEVIQILGRPIRLADVLMVVEKSKPTQLWYVKADGTFCSARYDELNNKGLKRHAEWNLLDDNLDNQSDECKQFLIDLLVK